MYVFVWHRAPPDHLTFSSSALLERVSQLEATVTTLQERLKKEEETNMLKVSQYRSLEERNAELTTSLESAKSPLTVSKESSDKILEQELEQTKSKLNDAQARLEEDDSVVLKWQGRLAKHTFYPPPRARNV